MGIQGFLQVVSPSIEKKHLKDFSYKTIGIDGFVWLHRGAVLNAGDLMRNPKRYHSSYINFFKNRINLLRKYHIKPFIVFDGKNIVMKKNENDQRKLRRQKALKEAQNYDALGDINQANKYYQRALSITDDMVTNIFNLLVTENIPFVRAPYEADAQLAYLNIHKHVDMIITEDSDLIAFGARHLLLKLDRWGNVDSLKYDDIFKKTDFKGLTHEQLLSYCILVGCDYGISPRGIGPKTALKISRDSSVNRIVLRAKQLASNKNDQEMANFEIEFFKALICFFHHTIFDISKRITCPLRPLPVDYDGPVDFLGEIMDKQEANTFCLYSFDNPLSRSDSFTMDSKKKSLRPWENARIGSKSSRLSMNSIVAKPKPNLLLDLLEKGNSIRNLPKRHVIPNITNKMVNESFSPPNTIRPMEIDVDSEEANRNAHICLSDVSYALLKEEVIDLENVSVQQNQFSAIEKHVLEKEEAIKDIQFKQKMNELNQKEMNKKLRNISSTVEIDESGNNVSRFFPKKKKDPSLSDNENGSNNNDGIISSINTSFKIGRQNKEEAKENHLNNKIFKFEAPKFSVFDIFKATASALECSDKERKVKDSEDFNMIENICSQLDSTNEEDIRSTSTYGLKNKFVKTSPFNDKKLWKFASNEEERI
eukprot:TRINITY_DN339_c0_g1_i1.p1 TRINITY_DN339_c0_g1~~TRINITY_DN339_c0_g1_i1.p1  ORF type:complete len:690 (-),score=192.28 TRINITY_DN339_c0_g1_i1:1085-3037(-)